MNIEKLKQLLIDNKIYVSEKPKNFLCRCFYCGDHPDSRKKGHLWVSKNPEVPVAHCFFCNKAVPIQKFLVDVTGNKEIFSSIFSEEEIQKQHNKENKPVKSFSERFKIYQLPKIEIDSFQQKRLYIRGRVNNLIDVEKIPNLILDFQEFFKLNHLDLIGENKLITNYEFDILQNKFIGFLGKHNTILFCRNIDSNDHFKFKKIQLQSDQLELMEYYEINNNDNKNIICFSEGNFNILSEHLTDSLNIKKDVNSYIACNGFNYSTVLKSVCFDKSLFKVDIIILGDRDKLKYHYTKFLKDNSHIINSCKIFLNRSGKDFNVFPLVPFEIV